MKDCKDVYQHICENLDQDLNSPACREIRSHIEGCADCRVYLDTLKQTIYLYRALPSPGVPRTVHTQLIRSINLSLVKRVTRRRTKVSARRRRSR